jgi:hypothetical protein
MSGEIREKHDRFYNEPCDHVPDSQSVDMMWENSENEFSTNGEEEDQDPIEPSSEEKNDAENRDDCVNEKQPFFTTTT